MCKKNWELVKCLRTRSNSSMVLSSQSIAQAIFRHQTSLLDAAIWYVTVCNLTVRHKKHPRVLKTWRPHHIETFSLLLALWGESTHRRPWRGALMFSLLCACSNDCAINRDTCDFWRHRAHYDVTVIDFFVMILGRILNEGYINSHYRTGFRYQVIQKPCSHW